ncbi:hypothetical protein [Spirillospora sp. CA-294931]
MPDEQMPEALPNPEADPTHDDEEAVLRELYGEPNSDGVYDGEEK